jgi:hypothetical protein
MGKTVRQEKSFKPKHKAINKNRAIKDRTPYGSEPIDPWYDLDSAMSEEEEEEYYAKKVRIEDGYDGSCESPKTPQKN